MSGLEGLGIACNVMAVITFALDTVKLCKAIHETGSADPSLDENAKNTRQTSDTLETMLSQQRQKPTAAEARLRALAASCVQYAKDVEKVVVEISPQKAGVFAAMKSTMKTLRRKARLEKLKSQLEASKNAMDSAVIVQILDECIASGELHRTAYENLSGEQKTLVATYERRSRAIEDLIRQVPDHVTAEHVETRQALTKRADLSEARDHEKQAYERLLESLKYPRMDERKNSVPRRHVKTLEWIFGGMEIDKSESDADADSDTWSSHSSEGHPMPLWTDPSLRLNWQYELLERAEQAKQNLDILEWLRYDNRRLYWVSGKPGSGKSTLMKFIATDERTKAVLQDWDPKPTIISHFLWKPGSPLQQSLHGLLCSLLHQILSEDIDVAYQFLRNNPRLQMKRDESDWDMEDLEKFLFQAIRFSPQAYFILLDGLDELSKPHGGMDRLFGFLDKLVAEDRVKVCVSSRPERLFMDRLGSNPKLRMQDFTYGDILHYTSDVLESITTAYEDDLLLKIAKEICSRAEGVFIWVYVVLQNVKTGIEEFDETWENVYDRIIEMPPNLMDLYKDMWSRLGGNNKKYVQKAARYFQLVRYPKATFDEINIARLAISDDETLEDFTSSDKILPLQKLKGMCENTLNTLPSVSAGLLQVCKENDLFYPIDAFGNDTTAMKWESLEVGFIHRTAVDFLDSDEGIDLFGKYWLDDDIFRSVFIKGDLVLRSATAYERRPLDNIWRRIMVANFSNKEVAKGVVDDLLPLIHRHAIDENRDLLLLENCERVSRQHKFLFEAALHGHYDYVEDWLKSTGSYDEPAATFVLLGSCHGIFDNKSYSFNDYGRCQLMRNILQKHTWCGGDKLISPAVFNASDNIMLAWRCFMTEELDSKYAGSGWEDRRSWTEEVLTSFINAGVLAESPQPKYLMLVCRHSINVVHDNNGIDGIKYCSAVYIEVNDAYIIQILLDAPGETRKIIPAAGTGAFMRPVLGSNPGMGREERRFFRLGSDESQQKALETWMFGEYIHHFEEQPRDVFPDKAPGFVDVVDIGEFRSVHDALKEIGYELPEVNLSYFCPRIRWM